MKTIKLSLLAAGTMWLAGTASAAPLVYEDFNYSLGTVLANVNGGTGWLEPWTGANYGAGPNSGQQEFVVTNGLSWTNSAGGYVAGNGGAIYDHDGSAHGSFRKWFNPGLADTDFTNTYGSTIWFSFIATYDTASGSGCQFNPFQIISDNINGFGVSVLGPAGNGDLQVKIRLGLFGDAPAVGTFGMQGSAQQVLSACQPGTNLIVGRFTLGGGPGGAVPPYTGDDRLDVWLNPNSDPGTNSGPMWYGGFYANKNVANSQGRLGVRTGGSAAMTIDEVRIGTNFWDVVPMTANSPAQIPAPPQLTMEGAGTRGVEFNLAEATPTNSNSIVTYFTTNAAGSPVSIDATWVGKTPAAYTFTIAKPPAPGPTNFMAFAWLIPLPNGHIQALDNPNALQLAIISDGQGGARARLGYFVGSGGNLNENINTIFTTGEIAVIPSASFAGTWTLLATSDTAFTIIAPNGASASGALQSGDEGAFGSSVSFYVGVSPNGAPNGGSPALGYHMTVSSVNVTNSSGVTINPAWGPGGVVQSDFSNYGSSFTALNPPNWQILANINTCIFVMPASSVYRAEWGNACGTSAGANVLTRSTSLTSGSPWGATVPTTTLLSDSTNVAFITASHLSDPSTFFRVRVPYTP